MLPSEVSRHVLLVLANISTPTIHLSNIGTLIRIALRNDSVQPLLEVNLGNVVLLLPVLVLGVGDEAADVAGVGETEERIIAGPEIIVTLHIELVSLLLSEDVQLLSLFVEVL